MLNKTTKIRPKLWSNEPELSFKTWGRQYHSEVLVTSTLRVKHSSTDEVWEQFVVFYCLSVWLILGIHMMQSQLEPSPTGSDFILTLQIWGDFTCRSVTYRFPKWATTVLNIHVDADDLELTAKMFSDFVTMTFPKNTMKAAIVTIEDTKVMSLKCFCEFGGVGTFGHFKFS